MALGSGISAQIGLVQESTMGTAATVTRFYEFTSETLGMSKQTVQGQGLHAGGQFVRDSRRAFTTRDVSGGFVMNVPTRGLGLLLQNCLGSFGQTLAAATQIGVTGAYKQVHQPGALTSKTMTIQKGVPQTDGTVKPFTYVGCKVTDWEISCGTGEIAVMNVGIDGWDELTLATTPASAALATATYTATASEFHFQQGALLAGGTASTTAGLVSVAGGTTLASISAASVKVTNPMADSRYFFGNSGRKDEQIENDFRAIGGSLTAEFTSQAAVYDLFRADTATTMQLTFTGPANSAGTGQPNVLDIIIPRVRFDGESPKIGGPGIVTLTAPYTGLDDGTNAAIQVVYTSSDTVI